MSIDSDRVARIRELAARFRRAIEKRGHALCISFERFPRGSCGDATPLLGTLLQEQGFGTFDYMLGERPHASGVGVQSHAWLQQGNLVVDITADQFADIHDAVIVTIDSEWHRQWDGSAEHVADYRIYDDHTVARLHQAYEELKSAMNAE